MRFFSSRLCSKGLLQVLAGVLLFAIGIPLLAASGVSFSTIQISMRDTGAHTLGIVGGTSICGGIAFFISSIFKFHRWKQNPQQVSIGQGISLMFIGVAMISLPFTFSTMSRMVFGQGHVKVNKLGDHRLANIVAPKGLDDGSEI